MRFPPLKAKSKKSRLMKNKTPDFYIKQTLRLAKKAEGHTSPNPLVGCVIVKNGRIIASGYHRQAGKNHAEREALLKAGPRARGASLYVNLEPCSHYGRTPPCADMIIEKGIKEVVAAMPDPNPRVRGRGFKKIKSAGVRVRAGVMRSEAQELNRIFVKNMKHKMPYVFMKAGMSADGKIALKNGKSKWITSEQSRNHAQGLRKKADAILAGINTVLADNPRLDCRIDKRKRIKKVILDTRGRIPSNARLFRNTKKGEVFVFTSKMKRGKITELEKKGAVVVFLKAITPKAVLKKLFEYGVMSVLVEGGSAVASSFIRSRLADEIYLYIAPVIIGSDGLGYFGNMEFSKMRSVFRIEDRTIEKIGPDMLIRGRVKYV